MSSIFTPQNQVKLTNVSVVRLKKGGKRFELACYKNKVVEYRNRVTTDLDEVLQTSLIFSNVSKGEGARKEDLVKAFGTTDIKVISTEILLKGELQVSTKEREHVVDALRKDVATIIAEKCVNPATKRPYPISIIEKAMADLHVSLKPEASAKQQALDIIKRMERSDVIAIERAAMRIKIHVPVRHATALKAGLAGLCLIRDETIVADVDEDGQEGDAEPHAVAEDELVLEAKCEPAKYKAITALVHDLTKGDGSVYALQTKDTAK